MQHNQAANKTRNYIICNMSSPEQARARGEDWLFRALGSSCHPDIIEATSRKKLEDIAYDGRGAKSFRYHYLTWVLDNLAQLRDCGAFDGLPTSEINRDLSFYKPMVRQWFSQQTMESMLYSGRRKQKSQSTRLLGRLTKPCRKSLL